MPRAEQQALKGFEQKRVPSIETWSAKFDDLRSTIAGLEGERDNAELKLKEAFQKNVSDVDHQQSDDGDKLLVYKRGDFNVVLKRGKLKVNVKIGEKSKGDPPDANGDED